MAPVEEKTAAATTAKHYWVLDNGGRPFRVTVEETENSATNVRVEKNLSRGRGFRTLLEWYFVAKVFIGKSPKNPMTEFSGGHGEAFNGNSILVWLGDFRYVFIGWEIYSFEVAATAITEFVSPVGNNSVPYPFAFDADHRCYLFLERIVISGFPIEPLHRKSPYEWYYEACEGLQDRHGKLKIGNQIFNNYFHYPKTDWHQEYLRLQRINREDEDDPDQCDSIYLVGEHGTRPLSLEEFIAQRETFARDVFHVTGLQNFELLQKRV